MSVHVERAPLAAASQVARRPSPAVVAVRRSLGLWVFLPLVGVEVANAFARARVWSIDWQWTAYWSNAATYLAGPIAAATATAESVLYRRRGVEQVIGVGSRWRAQVGRVAAFAGWVVAAHLVGVLACAASAVSVHRDWRLPIGPTLPAFAFLIGWVFVGAALGWLWPSLAGPPLVAVIGAAVLTVVPIGVLTPFLRVDTATVGLAGLVTNPALTAAATVWWLALAASAAWLLVRHGPFAIRDGAVAVLVLVCAALLQVEQAHPFEVDAHPPALRCAGERPSLCVVRDYQPRLSRYAEPLDRLASALGELDAAAVPATFVQAGQRVAGSPPVGGVGVVSIDPAGSPDLGNLALDLAKTATGCPSAPYRGDGPLWAGELATAAWLLQQTGLGSPAELGMQAPTSAAQARTALAEAKAAC